jgi:hypothetical protein
MCIFSSCDSAILWADEVDLFWYILQSPSTWWLRWDEVRVMAWRMVLSKVVSYWMVPHFMILNLYCKTSILTYFHLDNYEEDVEMLERLQTYAAVRPWLLKLSTCGSLPWETPIGYQNRYPSNNLIYRITMVTNHCNNTGIVTSSVYAWYASTWNSLDTQFGCLHVTFWKSQCNQRQKQVGEDQSGNQPDQLTL